MSTKLKKKTFFDILKNSLLVLFEKKIYLHCTSRRSYKHEGWPWGKNIFKNNSWKEVTHKVQIFLCTSLSGGWYTWRDTQSRRRRPPWSASHSETSQAQASLSECLCRGMINILRSWIFWLYRGIINILRSSIFWYVEYFVYAGE